MLGCFVYCCLGGEMCVVIGVSVMLLSCIVSLRGVTKCDPVCSVEMA